MKCRHFFSFVLVLFLSFFFGSFIITENSFAVDDLSIVIDHDSSNSTNTLVFPNCDNSCFDQFSYLIFEPLSSVPYSLSDFPFYFSMTGYSKKNFSLPVLSSSIVFLSSDYDNLFYGNQTVPSHFSFRITLTDSLPSSGCPEPPSGDLSITSNGTYDVSSYATVTVDVPAEVIQGDYHDDLLNIQKSIIICGAILLVLYFFYCIYRLIIKNSGVH